MVARFAGIACLTTLVFGFIASPAYAQSKWYIGGGAGGTFLMDSELDDPTGILAAIGTETSFDTGYYVGGTVGYAWANNNNDTVFRLEGELSYRQNDFDQFTVLGFDFDMDGDTSALGLMVNGFYDIGTGTSWKPYLGGGIGLALVSINDATVVGIPLADDDDTVFAYQLGAGLGYEVNPNLTISLDYRFFATVDPDFTDPTGIEFSAEYMSHNIGLGLRYGF